MAGGPLGMDSYYNGIMVTVGSDANDFLGVARGFPFVPKALSTAAVKNGFSQRFGFLETIAAHVGNRKHFSRSCVLHNGWNQASGIPFELFNFFHNQLFQQLFRK